MNKCPNCGAPIVGEVCTYCGTPASARIAKAASKGRGARTLLDKILITVGILWLILILAVGIDMKYWRSATDLVAVLFVAFPGVILLWIGLRRKTDRRKTPRKGK